MKNSLENDQSLRKKTPEFNQTNLSYTQSINDVVQELSTNLDDGLTSTEANKRLNENG